MSKKEFSVETLARSYNVDRETIRRWRNKGIKGVCLEANTSEVQKGKPLMFSAESVQKFLAVKPNKELSAMLNADGNLKYSVETATPAQGENDPVIVHLRERRQRLLAQLEITNAALDAAMKASGKYEGE